MKEGDVMGRPWLSGQSTPQPPLTSGRESRITPGGLPGPRLRTPTQKYIITPSGPCGKSNGGEIKEVLGPDSPPGSRCTVALSGRLAEDPFRVTLAVLSFNPALPRRPRLLFCLVGTEGFEPPTPRPQTGCSPCWEKAPVRRRVVQPRRRGFDSPYQLH